MCLDIRRILSLASLRQSLRSALVAACCALTFGACASVDSRYGTDYDETDLWDSSIVFLRHIDVFQLTDANGAGFSGLSGVISAVAARGDDLFFVDQGAGKLVHASVAAMTVHTLAGLQNANATGLHAAIDGTVYVVDAFNREIVRFDPAYGEIDRIPVGHVLANPVDVVVLEDEHVLLVLDALDGRIAYLDALGGLQQINEPRAYETQSILSATMIGGGAGEFYLLDRGTDAVAGFSLSGHATGSYGGDDLDRVNALTADACGRFYVTDRHDGTLYVGFADMSLPGRRVNLPQLTGSQISDLWTDGSFLYVSTRGDGIFVFMLDPECRL